MKKILGFVGILFFCFNTCWGITVDLRSVLGKAIPTSTPGVLPVHDLGQDAALSAIATAVAKIPTPIPQLIDYSTGNTFLNQTGQTINSLTSVFKVAHMANTSFHESYAPITFVGTGGVTFQAQLPFYGRTNMVAVRTLDNTFTTLTVTFDGSYDGLAWTAIQGTMGGTPTVLNSNFFNNTQVRYPLYRLLCSTFTPLLGTQAVYQINLYKEN